MACAVEHVVSYSQHKREKPELLPLLLQKIKEIMKIKLLFAVSLIVTVLTAWFLVQNTLYLLGVGFTLENIILNELPQDYSTGDGSVFNMVIFVLWFGLPIVLALWGFTFVTFWKNRKSKRQNRDQKRAITLLKTI